MPMCDSSVTCPRALRHSLRPWSCRSLRRLGIVPERSPLGTVRSAAPPGASEVSRFSCGKYLDVLWGLRLRRTAPGTRVSAPGACCLPHKIQRRRRPDWGFSEFNTQPVYSSVYASCRPSRSAAQNSRPSGSLVLTRKASSTSAFHRFIPAHGFTPSRYHTSMRFTTNP